MANGNSVVERLARPKVTPLASGARTDAAGKAVDNVILLSLPDEEYNSASASLEPAELPQYQIMHEPGEKIDFAYFLNEGMTSLVALSADGRSVEVGIVGREGMVGIAIAVGLLRGRFAPSCKCPAAGLRIRSEIFQEVLPCASTLQAEAKPFRPDAWHAGRPTRRLQPPS